MAKLKVIESPLSGGSLASTAAPTPGNARIRSSSAWWNAPVRRLRAVPRPRQVEPRLDQAVRIEAVVDGGYSSLDLSPNGANVNVTSRWITRPPPGRNPVTSVQRSPPAPEDPASGFHAPASRRIRANSIHVSTITMTSRTESASRAIDRVPAYR